MTLFIERAAIIAIGYNWYAIESAIFGVSCAAFVSNSIIFLLVVTTLNRKPVKVNKV